MMVGALSHATIFGEYILCILCCMLGPFLGHVTNIVQRIYARRSEYEAKWRDLKQFTEVHNVPKQLKQRMQDYFQTVWSINHGIDVSQVSSIDSLLSTTTTTTTPLKMKSFVCFVV